MKKISTVFEINRETGTATPNVRIENQWVVDGEGIATLKVDGSSCFFSNGQLYKRFDRKLKKQFDILRKKQGDKFKVEIHMFRDLPEEAISIMETYDPVTYHWPFWVPVKEDAPEDQFHNNALKNFKGSFKEGQSYELVGPSIGGNLYELSQNELWDHGSVILNISDRSFEGLKKYIIENNEEGIVFHHSDGRMAKLRRKDFSISNEMSWKWKDAKTDEFI